MIDNKHLFEMRSAGGLRPVIAAGPITKQRGTQPYRWELCDLGRDGYVVCMHIFEIPANGIPTARYYGSGSYFTKTGDLKEAVKCFSDKVYMDAECISSILADQGVQQNVASVPRSVPEEDTAEFSQPGEATG